MQDQVCNHSFEALLNHYHEPLLRDWFLSEQDIREHVCDAPTEILEYIAHHMNEYPDRVRNTLKHSAFGMALKTDWIVKNSNENAENGGSM